MKKITTARDGLQKISPSILSAIAFMIVFLILFLCGLCRFNGEFFFDAKAYWGIGNSLSSDGKINLFNLRQLNRGYVFPLILQVFAVSGEFLLGYDKMGFLVFNSLYLSVLITIIVPSLFRPVKPVRRLMGSFLCAGLFSIIFGELISQPLSDAYSLGFLAVAALLLRSIYVANKAKSYWKILLKMLLSGVFVYCAYNIRTIYLFSALAFLVLFICRGLLSKPIKNHMMKYGVCLLSLILGFALAATPQVQLNQQYNGKPTWQVITGNLFARQLIWGLELQRYETSVDRKYPVPDARFQDPAGLYLTDKYALMEDELFTFGKYFQMILENPLDCMAIYMRHLVHLLTPLYFDIYIRNLSGNKESLFLLNFLIYFIVASSMATKTRPKQNLRNAAAAFINSNAADWALLLIPCFFIIPGAPELRFFLAVHLLAYGFLSYSISYGDFWAGLKRNLLPHCIISAAAFLGWITIISSTLSLGQFQVFLF